MAGLRSSGGLCEELLSPEPANALFVPEENYRAQEEAANKSSLLNFASQEVPLGLL